MGLVDSRRRFFQMREKCKVLIRNHAFKDYPDRGFTKQELINLVRHGGGRFKLNNESLEAIEGSFLFLPKDAEGRECKLVILIGVVTIEIERKGSLRLYKEEVIKVCSAYRMGGKNETESV